MTRLGRPQFVEQSQGQLLDSLLIVVAQCIVSATALLLVSSVVVVVAIAIIAATGLCLLALTLANIVVAAARRLLVLNTAGCGCGCGCGGSIAAIAAAPGCRLGLLGHQVQSVCRRRWQSAGPIWND